MCNDWVQYLSILLCKHTTVRLFTSDFTRMISIMRDRVVSDTQTPVGDKATVCIFGITPACILEIVCETLQYYRYMLATKFEKYILYTTRENQIKLQFMQFN